MTGDPTDWPCGVAAAQIPLRQIPLGQPLGDPCLDYTMRGNFVLPFSTHHHLRANILRTCIHLLLVAYQQWLILCCPQTSGSHNEGLGLSSTITSRSGRGRHSVKSARPQHGSSRTHDSSARNNAPSTLETTARNIIRMAMISTMPMDVTNVKRRTCDVMRYTGHTGAHPVRVSSQDKRSTSTLNTLYFTILLEPCSTHLGVAEVEPRVAEAADRPGDDGHHH